MAEEANLQKRVVAELKKHGGKVLNIHGGPMQEAGNPDLLYVLDGWALFVELKARQGKVSEIQKHRIQQWQDAGAAVLVGSCFKRLQNEISRWVTDVKKRRTPKLSYQDVREDEIDRLSPRTRHMLIELAAGIPTGEVARAFGVSSSRVSDIKASRAGRAYLQLTIKEIERQRIRLAALAPLESVRRAFSRPHTTP